MKKILWGLLAFLFLCQSGAWAAKSSKGTSPGDASSPVHSLHRNARRAAEALDQDKELNQVVHIYDDLVACFKAAIIEQGGPEYLPFVTGQIAMRLGFNHTIYIQQYPRLREETAKACLSYLGIKSNGKDALFKKTFNAMPSLGDDEDQALTRFTSGIMAVYLLAAAKKAPLSPQEQQMIEWIISQKLAKINPANDGVSNPEVNPLRKIFMRGSKKGKKKRGL